MVESVVSINVDTNVKETLISEDSVPTDLTVSVSAPSQDQEISEISSNLNNIEDDEKRPDPYTVKRLRSELAIQKLLVAQKNVETERLLADKREEIELLKQHVHLSSRENDSLKRENNTLQQDIVNLQTNNLRFLSENKVMEETASKSKEDANGLEKKLTELTAKHKRILNGIEKDEFTFEKFELLQTSQNLLIVKCQTLDKETASARKSVDKWKKKFTNLRKQYEDRLQEEVAKIRHSLQKQIEMLRTSSTEIVEARLLETEQRREKVEQDLIHWRNLSEKLKSKMRELESADNKKRLQIEQIEATKNELVQRLSVMMASKARLERDLSEYKKMSLASIDSLKHELSENEKRLQQNETRVENMTKTIHEYEEAFLALYGVEEESNRWPTLLKVQSQLSSRMTKKVTQLETEKEIFQKQANHLANKMHQLEAELESKERLLSQFQERAPETVGLFRENQLAIRELRSQVNCKDLQLMEYARQVERLKRTRNQLVSDLEEVLRDRTALEAVKNILMKN